MPAESTEGKNKSNLRGDTSSIEGKDLDEAIARARDLINTLVKTIKAFRLYPPENPSLVGFCEQVCRKFQEFLSQYHIFVLQVEESTLSFQGVALYENPDVKTSLAFHLYKDGLRELRFMEGLEDWEVDGLIHILKSTETINQTEDDVVTMLWEKEFLHIGYLATEAYLDDTSVIIPANVEQFREKINPNPPDQTFLADFGEEMDGTGTDYYELLKKAEDTPLVAVNRSVYFLSPEELEELRKEVEQETAPTFIFNVIDILFEILALDKSPLSYQTTIHILQKLLDALIIVGEFKRAGDLLTRLNIILSTYELEAWQKEAIEKMIEKAGEAEGMERIGKILEKAGEVPLEGISRYLSLLKANSIPPLIDVLGETSNSKSRRMICEVLVERGKNNPELFFPFLEDPRWFLVRNILYILGRIGKGTSVPIFQKVLQHQEARVRREGIQALGMINDSRVFSLLREAIKDADDRNRSMAALNLARVGKKASLPALLEEVQSKDFYKRDAAEIKAFFDAIGMVGSKEAIQPLQKMLEQKGWFEMGKKDQIRLGAANALALIGTPEARAILEVGRNSKDESIRRACMQAERRQTSKEFAV
ncbi:MAG: HEAT repeat domain-containing protein [Deltaproteobacteria bacterium]|nr:HEAT repeat domain-containing protein [Deltaproteobacteria bacterium]